MTKGILFCFILLSNFMEWNPDRNYYWWPRTVNSPPTPARLRLTCTTSPSVFKALSTLLNRIIATIVHMSAEPKWCFSKMPKGETNIFQLRTTHWFMGYASPNQIHLLFGTFAQKNGSKQPKLGVKVSDWYGMVWYCHPRSFLACLSPKHLSNYQKKLSWKSDFWKFGRYFETHYMTQL